MAGNKKFEVGFNLSAALTPAFSGTLGKASKQMSRFGAVIKQAETGQKSIKRFSELRYGLNETKTALVDARAKAAALKKEFDNTAKPTKKLSAQVAAAHKNVHRLETKLRSQRRALGAAKGGLDQAGISTRNLAKENSRLAASIDKAKAAQNRLNRARATMAGAKPKMGSMGGKAMAAGAITGAAMAAPIFSTASLNQEMSRVQALSGATQAEYNKMRALAGSLGETTSFTAKQAAEGMSYLSMAGFKVNETMAAMPGVLNVAKAAGEDLGLTADIASNILSGFGIKATEMGRVGDVLTQTFTSSNTNLADLGETMKTAAPMAKILGVSLEETAAMAGLLANVGIKGSLAGTGIQATMSRLAAPKGPGADAMASLGVNSRDEMGNARNVIEVLGDLSEAMEGMGTGEKTSYLKDIFGQEHFKTAASLLEVGTVGIRKYHNEIQQAHKIGKASQVARIMDDNEIGRWQGFKSAVDGAARVLGDALAPAVNSVLSGMTRAVRGVTAWMKGHKTIAKVVAWSVPIIGGLTTAALGLGAALAGIKFAVAGLAVLGPVFGGIKAAFAGLSVVGPIIAGAKALFAGLAIVTAPISGTVLAIGAAVVGVGAAVYQVYKHWDKLKGCIAELWGNLTKAIDKMAVFSKMGGWLKDKFSFSIFGDSKNKEKGGKPGKTFSNIPKTNGQISDKSKNVNDLVNQLKNNTGNNQAEMLKKAAGLSRSVKGAEINQTVAPVINIAPGVDAKGVKAAISQSMTETKESMKTALENVLAQERRLAYE